MSREQRGSRRTSTPCQEIPKMLNGDEDKGYAAFCKGLERPPRVHVTRGVAGPIPQVFAGHFVMYKQRRRVEVEEELLESMDAMWSHPNQEARSRFGEFRRIVPHLVKKLEETSLNPVNLFRERGREL